MTNINKHLYGQEYSLPTIQNTEPSQSDRQFNLEFLIDSTDPKYIKLGISNDNFVLNPGYQIKRLSHLLEVPEKLSKLAELFDKAPIDLYKRVETLLTIYSMQQAKYDETKDYDEGCINIDTCDVVILLGFAEFESVFKNSYNESPHQCELRFTADGVQLLIIYESTMHGYDQYFDKPWIEIAALKQNKEWVYFTDSVLGVAHIIGRYIRKASFLKPFSTPIKNLPSSLMQLTFGHIPDDNTVGLPTSLAHLTFDGSLED